MADVNLIGNEVYFEGFLVALLVETGTPPTFMDQFTYGLLDGTLFLEEDTDAPKCPECEVEAIYPHLHDCSHYEPPKVEEAESEYDCAMDDILRSMKPFNKGGLIRWEDLKRIVAQLKEESEVETTAS